MAILWLYYGYTMAILWLYYGCTMAILWLYYGCTMAAWPVAMMAKSPSRSSSSPVSVTPDALASAVAAEPCV